MSRPSTTHHNRVAAPSKRLMRKHLSTTTPLDAPVLCLIRTGNSTGSQLVATLHTTLETSLSDIRAKLTGIAATARSRLPLESTSDPNVPTVQSITATKGAPVNYVGNELDLVTTARLHAFDLTASFRFVKNGGSKSISRGREATLRLIDVIPVIPRFGLPKDPVWTSSPPFGPVVVTYTKPLSTAATPTAVDSPTATLREALVVLFVAQGDFPDDMHSEKVVLERLLLQQQSYGRNTSVKQLSGVIHKWNANVRDFIGRTPLHEYAFEGNLAAVKYLLSLPFVRIEERDMQGNTALHLSVASGSLECATALLDAGAQMLTVNNVKQTPLHVAVYKRHDELVEIFCRRLKQQQVPLAEVNKLIDANGNHPAALFKKLAPPVDDLIRAGHVDALRAMSRHYLFSGASLNTKRRYFNSESILHLAARSGKEEVIKFLLEETKWMPNDAGFIVSSGADSGSYLLDGAKRSPLHIACMYGHSGAVKRLLAVMPKMCALPDITGRTPLMLALVRHHESTAAFIVDNALDVGANCVDRHGFTALHLAASIGATEVALRLITRFSAEVDAHTTTTVMRKRRMMSTSSRPIGDDKQELLRFMRRIKVKYSRLRKRRPAPLPVYERTTQILHGSTPLWCALHAAHGCGMQTAALLLSHGAGSTFIDEGYLPSLLKETLRTRQFELATAIVRLMGPSASQESSVLALFCANVATYGTDPIRWLSDRKVGTDNLSLALTASVKAGDAKTVRFLLDGAQNISAASTAAILLAAIESKQIDIVGDMVRRGVALTNVEESRAPLIIAAKAGLESVVRAMSTHPSIATFDLVTALVAMLRSVPRQLNSAAKQSWNAMGVSLLKRLMLQDAHVHPIEMIHFSASKGLFSVVEELVRKLVNLPSDARVTIVKSAPNPPLRPVVTVTPKTTASRKKELTTAANSKRKHKPLYKPLVSFERYLYTAPSSTIMDHRQKYRDAFSFLAEAGCTELIDSLIVDVRLSPWRQGDLRGWNAVDYAFHTLHYEAAIALIASGLLPLRHHDTKPASKFGQLEAACKLALARVRRASDQGAAASLRTLLEALAELGFREPIVDLLTQLCVLLKQPTLQGVPWLLTVVRAAVQHRRLNVLQSIVPAFLSSISNPISDGGEEMLVTAIVHHAPADIIDFLLVHGAPVHVPSPVSRFSIRKLKAGAGTLTNNSKVTALVAAAAVKAVDVCRKLLVAAGPPTILTDDTLQDPITVAIQSARACEDESRSATLEVVETLCNHGVTLSSSAAASTMRLAAKKRLVRTVCYLLQHHGYRVLCNDISEDDETLDATIIGQLLISKDPLVDEVLVSAFAGDSSDDASLLDKKESDPEEDYRIRLVDKLRSKSASQLTISLCLRHHHLRSCALLCVMGYSLSPHFVSVARPKRSASCDAITTQFIHVLQTQTMNKRESNLSTLLEGSASLSIPHMLSALLDAHRIVTATCANALPDVDYDRLVGSAVASGSRRSLEFLLSLGREQKIVITSQTLVQSGLYDTLASLKTPSRHVNNEGIADHSISSSLLAQVNAESRSRGYLPADMWSCLRLSQSLLTQVLSHAVIRRCLVFEREQATFSRITPISLAVTCCNETLLRTLLEYGANPTCQHSELCPLAVSYLTRKRYFGSQLATDITAWRWKASKSAVTNHHPNITSIKSRYRKQAHPHPSVVEGTSPKIGGLFTMCDAKQVLCRVSPLTLALHGLYTAYLSSAVDSMDIERSESILILLLRRGALTRDLIDVSAMVAITLKRWNILTVIIEEAQRVVNSYQDSDRFFKTIAKTEDIPLLLRNVIGDARHVLHAACRHASRDAVILLARHCVRADVESSRDALGRIPVYHCLYHAQKTITLETLCALQVPCNAPCEAKTRRTPLMIAAKIGNTAAVACLIKFGGINAVDSEGNTPLMFAAACGKQDVVELLLSAQADASIKNDLGLTAVMIAARNGFDNIALPMAQHFSRLVSYTTASTTVLHCAAIGGCKRLAEHIVRTYETIGIFQEDDAGMTPVYLAYAFGHGSILRMMLTALQHRTETPMSDVDKQLLECSSTLPRFGWLSATLRTGAALLEETKKRSKFSLSPWELTYAPPATPLGTTDSRLLWCARNSFAVGVRVLADFNVSDDCNCIHEAAKRGALDVLQLLVALRMSDPNARDSKGWLPVEHAVYARHEECAVFLIQSMRLSVETIFQSIQESGTSLIHLIAMSGLHRILAVVLPKLLQSATPSLTEEVNVATDIQAAEATLRTLVQVDFESRTPFELAVLFGSASTTLRIAQAIQQLTSVANTSATVTLPSTLFELRPNIAPAVRAVLYDFFDVQEVCIQSAFPETTSTTRKRRRYLPNGDASQRLLFGDVRWIGIQDLRRDAYCAPKLEHVYTADHERQVLKQITQYMDLAFRLKFKPDGLRGLVAAEQTAILQRLSTSVLLGKYVHLSPKMYPFGTLELEFVGTRSDVGLAIQGSTITERFCVSKTMTFTTDVEAHYRDVRFEVCNKELTQTQGKLKTLVQNVRSLAHPMLKSLVMKIDWNGLELSKTTSAENTSADDDKTIQAAHGHASATVSALNDNLLPELQWLLCEGELKDTLSGIKEEDMQLVIGSAGVATIRSVCLRCFNSVDDLINSVQKSPAGGAPAVGHSSSMVPIMEGGDLIVPFFQTPTPSSYTRDMVVRSLQPLFRHVKKDVALLRVHQLRDQFVAEALAVLSTTKERPPSTPLKFKLETEGVDMDELPMHLLQELLNSTTAALETTTRCIRTATTTTKKHDGSSWKYITSNRIVAVSVAQALSNIVVLFSNKRSTAVRRSGSRLTLCMTPNMIPTRSEIENIIRRDTVEIELEKLREQIPVTVHDMSQRLNTYLPTTTLVVDLPSLSSLAGDDDILAALALLNYDRSAVVLQEIIRGVAIGWDTKLGTLIRRHVRQLSLTLQRSGGNATLSLTPEGHLIFHYPLQCVEAAQGNVQRISSWALLSSQQIASLLLMQLASMHNEIKSYVDLTKGYACWCVARGLHTRQVRAGDVRSAFTISVRNVLNMAPLESLDEAFEFASSHSLSSFRVTKVNSTSRKTTPHATSYLVKFSAPTQGSVFMLSVRLHGQPILNSPLRIRILPGPCSLSQTACNSTFNTLVEGKVTTLTYSLRDAHGNQLQSTPPDLKVDGPPPSNSDRVRLTSWASTSPGIVTIHVAVDKPANGVVIPVRFQLGQEQCITPYSVDVISEDVYQQIQTIKRGPVMPKRGTPLTAETKKVKDRVGLYFRSKVRESEAARKKRECRLVGGVKRRRFAK